MRGGRFAALALTVLVYALLHLAPVAAAYPTSAAVRAQAGEQGLEQGDGLTQPPAEQGPIALEITRINPTAVATQDRQLQLEGKVTNTSELTLENFDVRIQRGTAVADETGLRDWLLEPDSSFDTTGPFHRIERSLGPGESLTFSLSIGINQVTTPADGALGITAPGIYPLLINVNGQALDEPAAQLGIAPFLLPVLETPLDAGAAARATAGDTGEPAADAVADAAASTPARPAPSPLSVLWPLADASNVARPVLLHEFAEADGRARAIAGLVLPNDRLADSLSGDGRLRRMLDAYRQLVNEPSLTEGVCLAVEPALLTTVARMAEGYSVVADSAPALGSEGTAAGRIRGEDLVAGAGQNAAAAWLEDLRQGAQGRCVTALPEGTPPLEALANTGVVSLGAEAITGGIQTVEELLDTPVNPQLLAAPGGTAGPGAAQLVAGTGYRSLIIDDGSVLNQDISSSVMSSTEAGTPVGAITYSGELKKALTAVGEGVNLGAEAPPEQQLRAQKDSGVARRNNALASLYYRAVRLSAVGELGADQPSARPILMVPPQGWNPSSADLTALLGGLKDLTARRWAQPTGWGVWSERARVTGVHGSFIHTESPAAQELASRVGEEARRWNDLSETLTDAAAGQDRLAPASTLLDPLRTRLLQSLCYAACGHPDQALEALNELSSAIDALFGGIGVLPPGSVYTMSSASSPLLLVARNDLPVPVRVRVQVTTPAGLRVDDPGIVEIPAAGSRTLQLSTHNEGLSGRATVAVSITTPSGRPIGQPAELVVQSSMLTTIVLIVTVLAGGILIVLVGRRLWHRVRGIPDRADPTPEDA